MTLVAADRRRRQRFRYLQPSACAPAPSVGLRSGVDQAGLGDGLARARRPASIDGEPAGLPRSARPVADRPTRSTIVPAATARARPPHAGQNALRGDRIGLHRRGLRRQAAGTGACGQQRRRQRGGRRTKEEGVICSLPVRLACTCSEHAHEFDALAGVEFGERAFAHAVRRRLRVPARSPGRAR